MSISIAVGIVLGVTLARYIRFQLDYRKVFEKAYSEGVQDTKMANYKFRTHWDQYGRLMTTIARDVNDK